MSAGGDRDCIFCRITSGELPCREVYSGPLAYAFHDQHPVAPLHVLVVPREHIPDASHVGPQHAEALAEMMSAARSIAVGEDFGQRGYRLAFNVGPDAGTQVAHLHMHVLAGRPLGWPPG